MTINRQVVLRYLNDFFNEEDKNHQHIDLIVDLSWIGAIILEFGFQCSKDKQEERKEKLFGFIEKLSETMAEAKILANNYEYDHVFPAQSNKPTFKDLAVVCDLFYKIVVQEKTISKEKMLEWLTKAWNFGTQQRRVYNMEIEGGVMNEYGVVISFGADLVMFGKSRGFLPN